MYASRYGDALTCDFAEYYHVLDWRSLPLGLAACLAAGLRDGSRCRMMLSDSRVDTGTLLLANIADGINLVAWMLSSDGRSGCNRPTSLVDIVCGRASGESGGAIEGFESAGEFERARRMLGGVEHGD